jgi:lipopolysaccharide/colanic/teichoic acid biosynthesis glycosyltransferase
VRPGITGRAQLRFRNEAELLATADPEATYITEILPAKTAIDVAYAKDHDLIDDLRILMQTVTSVLSRD